MTSSENPFSLVTEKGMTFENYVTAFDKMDYLRSFGNSLFVTGLSTLIVIILCCHVRVLHRAGEE